MSSSAIPYSSVGNGLWGEGGMSQGPGATTERLPDGGEVYSHDPLVLGDGGPGQSGQCVDDL